MWFNRSIQRSLHVDARAPALGGDITHHPRDRRYPRISRASVSESCRLCAAAHRNEQRGRPRAALVASLAEQRALVPLAVAAPAASATAAAAVAVTGWPLLLARARRCVLGALDQL